MGVRAGAAYIAGLKQHPRDVWVQGRHVRDVTADPVFRRPIEAIARLYDIQTDPEYSAEMTYRVDETGEFTITIPRGAQ